MLFGSNLHSVAVAAARLLGLRPSKIPGLRHRPKRDDDSEPEGAITVGGELLHSADTFDLPAGVTLETLRFFSQPRFTDASRPDYVVPPADHRAALDAYRKFMRKQRLMESMRRAQEQVDWYLTNRMALEQGIALNAPDPRESEPADWFDTSSIQALPAEDKQRLAIGTAATINQVLARAFLRLGPPPQGASGDSAPVTSGGGGAEQ
ncbi:hypothetical protein [Streptomyces mirabilis]|uniref:hypothetical protein n=1 Tax=Streptomyces mirabilis TaxID=68239 RepID=UPI0033A89898